MSRNCIDLMNVRVGFCGEDPSKTLGCIVCFCPCLFLFSVPLHAGRSCAPLRRGLSKEGRIFRTRTKTRSPQGSLNFRNSDEQQPHSDKPSAPVCRGIRHGPDVLPGISYSVHEKLLTKLYQKWFKQFNSN